ncbi:MAG: CPBP family intramembrane metalloprotease [Clostridiales bacterium]|nr:CPBP family intramembrane metalloprotease [Clostridiales bacterium]
MKNNSYNIKSQYSMLDSYKTYFNMFLFQILVSFIFTIIISVTGIANTEFSKSPDYTYVTCLLSPAVFALLFFWQNRGKQYNIRQAIGLNKKIKIKYILFAILIGVICITFFSNISNLFDTLLELIGFNPDDNINVRTDNIGFLFLNILMLGLLPAIFEDLIFRGIIFTGLKSENSTRFAVIVSALLFAIMHGSLQQTFYQFIIGIILALVMNFTGNIIYPIITHLTNNAIVLISHYFTMQSGGMVVPNWSFTNIFVATLLSILGVLLLYIIFRYIAKANVNVNKTRHLSEYTFTEKFYAICGVSIAIISWIFTTISMWS